MLLALRFPRQSSPKLLSHYLGCISGAGVADGVGLHSEDPAVGTALGCQGWRRAVCRGGAAPLCCLGALQPQPARHGGER